MRRTFRRSLSILALLVALSAAAAGAATAAVPSLDIGAPAGPLNKVAIGNDLSCQLQHVGDTSFEFYPPSATPGDCGTFVSVDGTLFAPDFANHDGTATSGLGSNTPFTAVSQSPVGGAGTSASPRTLTTVASAGSSGLQVSEKDTYVNGQESYRTDVTVSNSGGAAKSGVLYRAGDCYLQNTDNGFGFSGSPDGSVGCSQNANNAPPGRIEQWVPITPGDTWTEDGYSAVWGKIGAQTPFTNDCVHCGDQVDNGAGISWTFTVNPGQSVTFAHYTTFSPTGRTGPPPPPVEGPAGNPLGLPSNRKCIDTRKWKFRLHHPSSDLIKDVQVFINSKRKRHLKATLEGSGIERLTLKKLPKKKFKVRIVATRESGVKSISVRTYKGCKKSKSKTRGVHPR